MKKVAVSSLRNASKKPCRRAFGKYSARRSEDNIYAHPHDRHLLRDHSLRQRNGLRLGCGHPRAILEDALNVDRGGPIGVDRALAFLSFLLLAFGRPPGPRDVDGLLCGGIADFEEGDGFQDRERERDRLFLGEELRGRVRHALITQTEGDRELGEELVYERREKFFCSLRLGFHDCAGEHFESVVTRNCR